MNGDNIDTAGYARPCYRRALAEKADRSVAKPTTDAQRDRSELSAALCPEKKERAGLKTYKVCLMCVLCVMCVMCVRCVRGVMCLRGVRGVMCVM